MVQANLSGTTLTLTGIAAGSSTINVCASTGTCASLPVTVQYSPTGGSIALSQNTLSLFSGQNINVTISGGEEPYTVSGGTSSVSQETLTGSNLTVYGIASGTSSVNVCSAGGGCILLAVTVNGTSTPSAPVVSTPVATVTTPAAVAVTPAYTFTGYLAPGSQNAEVTKLQNVLAAQGDFSGTATGYFGNQTKAAVIKFQAAHAIKQLGVVGPATRAILNQIESANISGNSTSSAVTTTMTLSQLQTEAQSLESQLTQVLNRITQLTGQ